MKTVGAPHNEKANELRKHTMRLRSEGVGRDVDQQRMSGEISRMLASNMLELIAPRLYACFPSSFRDSQVSRVRLLGHAVDVT